MICSKCKKRKDCKKLCKDMNKYLKKKVKEEYGGYSERHLQRKELLWDSKDIEDLAAKEAFRLKYGQKNRKDTGESY